MTTFQKAGSGVPSSVRHEQTSSAAQPARGTGEDQEVGRKWEIDVHGGLSVAGSPKGGSASMPVTGAVVQGRPSVSTFYFGEGAKLLNQNLAGVSGGPVSIVPLDSVLLGSAIRRETAGSVGFRLERSLFRYLGVEFAGDWSLSSLSFRPSSLSAIEATRASFAPAIERALSSAPVTSAAAADAVIDDHHRSRQLFATGAVTVRLHPIGSLVPYVLGGGGVVQTNTDGPSAILTGRYQLGSPPQVLASDVVTLRYSEDGRAFVFVGGGGVKKPITPRWGIRVDARLYAYRNSTAGMVDATPTLALQSTGQPYPIANAGAMQFSFASPLVGPEVAATTFSGSGRRVQLMISGGMLLRF